jgi:DNA-binding phage protein
MPFQTTPEQVLKLATIVVAMQKAKLPMQFIFDAQKVAQSDQGVFDLMEMWLDAKNHNDRDDVIADIQEVVEDQAEAPQQSLEKPRISFDELDKVAAQVMEFKKKLRDLIDRHGGVSAVARKSGIPQPSLSRMLNSATMPRRTTLYRIANALDVSEAEIATEWTR